MNYQDPLPKAPTSLNPEGSAVIQETERGIPNCVFQWKVNEQPNLVLNPKYNGIRMKSPV